MSGILIGLGLAPLSHPGTGRATSAPAAEGFAALLGVVQPGGDTREQRRAEGVPSEGSPAEPAPLSTPDPEALFGQTSALTGPVIAGAPTAPVAAELSLSASPSDLSQPPAGLPAAVAPPGSLPTGGLPLGALPPASSSSQGVAEAAAGPSVPAPTIQAASGLQPPVSIAQPAPLTPAAPPALAASASTLPAPAAIPASALAVAPSAPVARSPARPPAGTPPQSAPTAPSGASSPEARDTLGLAPELAAEVPVDSEGRGDASPRGSSAQTSPSLAGNSTAGATAGSGGTSASAAPAPTPAATPAAAPAAIVVDLGAAPVTAPVEMTSPTGDPLPPPGTPATPEAAARPPPPASQLLAHIQARAAGGQSSFTLRLDPAELGEVAVRLTFRRDGGASILVEAQEPAALDALMREARGLESALRDAGLKVSEDAIRFSLKSDGHDASGQQGQTPQPGAQSRPGRPGHDAERAPEPDIHVERWRHARLALIA